MNWFSVVMGVTLSKIPFTKHIQPWEFRSTQGDLPKCKHSLGNDTKQVSKPKYLNPIIKEHKYLKSHKTKVCGLGWRNKSLTYCLQSGRHYCHHQQNHLSSNRDHDHHHNDDDHDDHCDNDHLFALFATSGRENNRGEARGVQEVLCHQPQPQPQPPTHQQH